MPILKWQVAVPADLKCQLTACLLTPRTFFLDEFVEDALVAISEQVLGPGVPMNIYKKENVSAF